MNLLSLRNAQRLCDELQVANIVLIFVVIFAVCWLPRHAYLIGWYYDWICYNAFWHCFKAISLGLTFVYSAVNPFTLYIINDQFRRYFQHYLCGRCDATYAPFTPAARQDGLWAPARRGKYGQLTPPGKWMKN